VSEALSIDGRLGGSVGSIHLPLSFLVGCGHRGENQDDGENGDDGVEELHLEDGTCRGRFDFG
jgi:hypothetical protein